jgi:hypothetical protein
MRMGNIIFVFAIVCIYLVLIAGLVGFILVQIKARPIWRLLSLTVVLLGSCWLCSSSTRNRLNNQYSETYVRGSAEFFEAIDQLNIKGRTNDVHQSLQKFSSYFFLSTDEQAISNFDRVVADTSELASEQPNLSPEPSAVGATNSAARTTPQVGGGSGHVR